MNSQSKSSIGPLLRRESSLKAFDLTKDQRRVVEHRGSPLVVLGGPGTGKTTVVIHAAVSRIEQGQDPNSLLILTYGRERASELRDDVATRIVGIMKEPIARTFYSLAFSILKMKKSPGDPDPILMSGPEQDFFIRELLEGDLESAKKYWPDDLIDSELPALATRGFARELRDLILRASERNYSPTQLAKFGKECGEKYWPAAAKFWEQYLGAMDLQAYAASDSKRRIDPSQIVIEAFRHVKNNPTIADELRRRFSTIVVDEYQESDPAQRALLGELAGEDILLCADGESAVGRFRGADPDQLKQELEKYSSKGSEIFLRDSFRSAPKIFLLGNEIAQGFPNSSSQRLRVCAVQESEGGLEPLLLGRFRSQSEEAQFIAYQFRRAHLVEGIPWSQMAVILRSSGAQASALQRAFARSGIPVSSESGALSGNASLAPFLLLAKIALKAETLNSHNCEELLLSEFGGADPVSLRRIRRAMLTSREEGDQRTGSELLVAAIEDGEIGIDGAEPLRRVHDLLSRAKKVLRRKGVQAEDLLWEIWNNAVTAENEKLSESWRRQALRGGSKGASADRDLDAAMELFEAARRFAERFPYSHPISFIEEISGEEIVGDVITSKGQRSEVVEILTVHSSKGREWELVAIAGLQEGAWPNLRQRGSLLGSERLVERSRHGILARAELDAVAASGLVEDERRLMYVAVTRAISQLVVTAVQKDDEEPSSFFEEIADFIAENESRSEEKTSDEPRTTHVPRPITASALVSTLRGNLSSDKNLQAASLLKRLSEEGLAEASPELWSGSLPISTQSPIVAPTELVLVSPSSAESFTECALKWFLEKNGGTNGDSQAQILGSAIHAFAALMEEDPSLSESDLVKKLRASWKLIDPNSGWVSTSQLERAVEMIRKFVSYHSASPNKVIGVEAEFSVVVARAHIRGSVDRLEVTAEGDLFVVDFKTGATAISGKDALTNKQMQSYQLAIEEGGFTRLHPSRITAGAELVYLGSSTQSVSTRKQPPIESDQVRNEIEIIAEKMSDFEFLATINKRCTQCAVRAACPIQGEGRAVME